MAKQSKKVEWNADEAMRVARACAFKARPYFAPVLMAARLVESEQLETLACDQYLRIYYNPSFVLGHSRWEIAGVLVHEIQHWLRRHFKRAQNIDCCNGQVWNIAGDLAINDDLLIPGDTIKLPEEGCFPSKMTPPLPENLIEEDYYARLMQKQPPQGGPGSGKGQGGPQKPQGGAGDCGSAADGQPREYELGAPTSKPVDGDGDEPGAGANDGDEDLSGVAEIDGDLLRRKVAEEVRRASVGRGTVPASLRRWADVELAPPTVPWQRVLRSQVRHAAREIAAMSDFTFTRVSRRANACPGIVLPGFTQPVVEIAIEIDESGSMGESDGRACLSEVQGICKQVGPVRVVTADAEVYSDQKNVTRASQVRGGGGGGTDMRVGIDHLCKLRRNRPNVIVVMTDGDTPWPSAPIPGVKIIACLTRKPYCEMPPSWIRTVMVGKNAEVGS